MSGKERSKQLGSDAKFAEGALRRFSMLGKPMKLWGQLLDGRPFDPSTLKGKVVLVNVVSMRNQLFEREPFADLKRHFEQYHGKGLEVVSVVDAIEDNAFEQLVEQEPLPWPAIVDKSKNADEYKASMTYYYSFNFEGRHDLAESKRRSRFCLTQTAMNSDRPANGIARPAGCGESAATEPPHAGSTRVVNATGKIERSSDDQLLHPRWKPRRVAQIHSRNKVRGEKNDWLRSGLG